MDKHMDWKHLLAYITRTVNQAVVPVNSKQRKPLTLYPLGITMDRSTFARPDAL